MNSVYKKTIPRSEDLMIKQERAKITSLDYYFVGDKTYICDLLLEHILDDINHRLYNGKLAN